LGIDNELAEVDLILFDELRLVGVVVFVRVLFGDNDV